MFFLESLLSPHPMRALAYAGLVGDSPRPPPLLVVSLPPSSSHARFGVCGMGVYSCIPPCVLPSHARFGVCGMGCVFVSPIPWCPPSHARLWRMRDGCVFPPLPPCSSALCALRRMRDVVGWAPVSLPQLPPVPCASCDVCGTGSLCVRLLFGVSGGVSPLLPLSPPDFNFVGAVDALWVPAGGSPPSGCGGGAWKKNEIPAQSIPSPTPVRSYLTVSVRHASCRVRPVCLLYLKHRNRLLSSGVVLPLGWFPPLPSLLRWDGWGPPLGSRLFLTGVRTPYWMGERVTHTAWVGTLCSTRGPAVLFAAMTVHRVRVFGEIRWAVGPSPLRHTL